VNLCRVPQGLIEQVTLAMVDVWKAPQGFDELLLLPLLFRQVQPEVRECPLRRPQLVDYGVGKVVVVLFTVEEGTVIFIFDS